MNYYHGSSLWSFSKRGVSGPRLLGGCLQKEKKEKGKKEKEKEGKLFLLVMFLLSWLQSLAKVGALMIQEPPGVLWQPR